MKKSTEIIKTVTELGEHYWPWLFTWLAAGLAIWMVVAGLEELKALDIETVYIQGAITLPTAMMLLIWVGARCAEQNVQKIKEGTEDETDTETAQDN